MLLPPKSEGTLTVTVCAPFLFRATPAFWTVPTVQPGWFKMLIWCFTRLDSLDVRLVIHVQGGVEVRPLHI